MLELHEMALDPIRRCTSDVCSLPSVIARLVDTEDPVLSPIKICAASASASDC